MKTGTKILIIYLIATLIMLGGIAFGNWIAGFRQPPVGETVAAMTAMFAWSWAAPYHYHLREMDRIREKYRIDP